MWKHIFIQQQQINPDKYIILILTTITHYYLLRGVVQKVINEKECKTTTETNYLAKEETNWIGAYAQIYCRSLKESTYQNFK